MLELLKIIVQPVVLERDPDGNITGEHVGEPTVLFTAEQLPEFVAQVRHAIERRNLDAVTDLERE